MKQHHFPKNFPIFHELYKYESELSPYFLKAHITIYILLVSNVIPHHLNMHIQHYNQSLIHHSKKWMNVHLCSQYNLIVLKLHVILQEVLQQKKVWLNNRQPLHQVLLFYHYLHYVH